MLYPYKISHYSPLKNPFAEGEPTRQDFLTPSVVFRSVTDGTENYVGALRNAMGVCGALSIKEFQKVKMVIAPSIKTEGKYFQSIQQSC